MVKVKESVRKCSQCGLNGHNSRTCHGKGLSIKLFGVRITTEKESESIRKTQSMVNLTTCNAEHCPVDAGYVSDGLIQSEKAHERKKGVPWTQKEHRSFLLGLENLGKGDWRGISKSYVSSRTPTQVASHAQKYFIRMSAKQKKKRRSSLFDMPLKEPSPSHHSSSTSPVSPPKPIAEVSQQSGTSPPSPMKNCSESQAQSTSPVQVLNPLEAPQVLPLAATYGFPPFPHVPYMLGLTSNGQRFPVAKAIQPIQFVPVMNFPSQVNFCLPRSHGHFNTYSPFLSPMSSGLLQQQLPCEPSQAWKGASVTKKDGLELGIGVK